MENQNNIKDLETLLNEAKMEQEIKSILEELGTNDAPEVVKAGEPDEIEGTATKEDVLPEEVEGEDVKEVVVESEEPKSKEVFDLEKDFPKDAKTTDDVEEVAGEAEKEDVLPEEVKGEDVKEAVVESEELKANESPEVVKFGNAEEASGEAEHEEVFPAEESAEDVKEVVVESEEISDLELMELLDESKEYEPSIKNVMLLREDKELLNEFLGLGGKAAAKRQLKIEQMKSENDPKKVKKLEKLEKRQGRFMRRAAAQSSGKGMKAFAKESEIQKDNAEKLKKAQANIQQASTTLNSSYEIKEEYTTLEEAFELGKARFADDVDKARLVEQVALSIAKENNDRIFVEMVNATVLAARLQEQLLEKYSDVSEARINMIFEEMEANDTPEVVKEGEPEEVAGEAKKEDVLPEEVEGEDVKEAEVE